jgi:glycosyltransferase involved in cell wall biosynthesis
MVSRDRIRVALISFNFGEYCVRLASGLAQHAEVLLLLPEPEIESHLAKLHEAVHLFTFQKPRFRQPVRQIRMIRTIFRRIHEFAPDVVHYQGGHPWFDLTLPLFHQYPLAFTIHDFRAHPGDRVSQKTPFWAETFGRGHADELIVHTRHVQELVRRQWPGCAKKVSVIPHIQIGPDFSSTETTEEEHLILFFGRIWKYKGLEYLIRAEPWITSRVPEARILIAGQGEDFSRYSRMMVHPDRFILDNDFIPEQRVAEYFRRASLVVLPYTEASQSGVIPIAYSAGKPVVATSVGGLPEMVEHGRTGYLVAPRNEVQLAEAITRLLQDRRLREQMGASGKRTIEVECSPSVIARKTMDVYLGAIETRAAVERRSGARSSPAVTSRSRLEG